MLSTCVKVDCRVKAMILVNNSVEQKHLKYLLGAHLAGNPPSFMPPESQLPLFSLVQAFRSNFSEEEFDILLPLRPTSPFFLSLKFFLANIYCEERSKMRLRNCRHNLPDYTTS